jgi:hypothetical protein
MGEWQQNSIKSTHHKEGKSLFFWSLVELSMAIFINKVLHSTITHQTRDYIDIQQVLTFLKILALLVSIRCTIFVNSNLPFKAFQKIIMQGLKQTFKFAYHLQM